MRVPCSSSFLTAPSAAHALAGPYDRRRHPAWPQNRGTAGRTRRGAGRRAGRRPVGGPCTTGFRKDAPVGAGPSYALGLTRPRLDVLARLGRRFEPVGLDGVLGDLDRTAEPCPVPGEAAGPGFTWEGRDRDDQSWWPQGVAALRSGEVLLVSWYATRRRLVRTPGARISVVDRTDPVVPRYRHVLLVAPHRRLGVLTVGTVPVHAGGIAVFGDLLYVAD